MSIPESYRYERKFVASDMGRAEAELLVKLHPAHFRRVYPNRYVNNIYFDTPSLTDFHTHVDGASERSKLRLRWYGPAAGPIERCTLEAKIKRGWAGCKRSQPLGPIDMNGTVNVRSVVRAIEDAGGARDLAERLACRTPAMFNRYRRDYYLAGDGRYRITIDSELEFKAVTGRCHSGCRFWHERDLVVIELKYDAGYDRNACEISGRMPFRLDRLSKYVRGMQRLLDQEP